MKSLLEFILLRMVEHPEDLEINEVEETDLTTFELKLHPDDIGRVIGRGGNVIKAIRKLAQVKAVREHLRVRVILQEE
ncbi:MAG TPA: KH domain-containing protein [Candidatus Woesebacteria bacterium]|nr:KH domain-containing protein [Candidatus Woesebacteria bacterium]